MNYDIDLSRAVLWQYAKSKNINAIIDNKQAFFDENHKQFWTDFYNNIFNLDTANEFGCKIWSIILDFPLFINNLQSTNPRFGFASDDVNFSQGNFEPIGGLTAQFSLETQRMALKLRYLQLTTSHTEPEINRALKAIIGNIQVIDLGDMQQRYIITDPLSFELLFLINNFDILPKPSGVKSTIYDNTQSFFGFNPDEDENFIGSFYGGEF